MHFYIYIYIYIYIYVYVCMVLRCAFCATPPPTPTPTMVPPPPLRGRKALYNSSIIPLYFLYNSFIKGLCNSFAVLHFDSIQRPPPHSSSGRDIMGRGEGAVGAQPYVSHRDIYMNTYMCVGIQIGYINMYNRGLHYMYVYAICTYHAKMILFRRTVGSARYHHTQSLDGLPVAAEVRHRTASCGNLWTTCGESKLWSSANRSPKDHRNIRIRHSGSEAQDK